MGDTLLFALKHIQSDLEQVCSFFSSLCRGLEVRLSAIASELRRLEIVSPFFKQNKNILSLGTFRLIFPDEIWPGY